MAIVLRLLILCLLAFSCRVLGADPQVTVFAPGVVKGSGPSFTPAGDAVYTFIWKEGKGHTILVSNLENGRWTPSRVAHFSGIYDDLEPCVSADGARLLFTSARPIKGRAGLRLWVMRNTARGWSAPQAMDEPINVVGAGSGASALASDGTLFFGSTRVSRAWPWEIFVARPSGDTFAAPERIGEAVNSTAFIWSHTVSPDGRTLVFASERPGGRGGIDLYVSRRRNGAWTPAQNLGAPVNTDRSEVWPRFSADGRRLFFSREGEDEGVIYQVETSVLGRE